MTGKNDLRVKTKFVSRIKLIWPVQSFFKNILIYRMPNQLYILSRPVAQKGAFRDRHGRCNGMRWTRLALQTYGADADGGVVWS
jgi:hypothetical protein